MVQVPVGHNKLRNNLSAMSKVVAMPVSSTWHCSVCTFENDPMMLVCELCSQPRDKDPPVIARGGSSDDKILCEKCTFKNTLDSVKCKVCGVGLFGDEVAPVEKLEELLPCPSCHFENAKDNKVCLSCESPMDGKSVIRAPGSPIKDTVLMECPICNCVLAQSLYERHYKDCQESAKILAEIERENKEILEREKEDDTDECPYCQIRVDKKLSEKHIIECSKTGKFFKKEDIFGRMTPVQKETIEFMHINSQKQHFSAKPQLQTKFKKLGLKKHDLEALHHYIENYAPIIVHIHITKHMEFFIKDTHYRNQFETGKSSGSLSRPSRIGWESRMFNKKYDKAKDPERVKYGTINFTNDPKGVNSCRGYGNSYFLLKSEVRQRCTLTDQDSSSASSLIGTFKFCYHVLNRLSDAELKAAVQAAKAMEVSSSVIGTYKEIQIHGPIEFAKDIQRLYVNKIEVQDPKFMKMVEEFTRKFKVDYQIFT